MNTRLFLILICVISILFLTSGGSAAPGASPLGTAFTYQGRMGRGGQPYTGTCNFQFGLWDAQTEGVAIGDVVSITAQPVSNGLFTAELDFGVSAFNGDARWLEVTVQCPGDSSPTTFARQQLTAAPYALYATSAPWGGLTGLPSGFADNVDDNTTFSAGDGLSLNVTTFAIDPANTQKRVSSACAVGSAIQEINEDGSVVCQAGIPGLQSFLPNKLDSTGNVGLHTSITVGMDWLGLISYYDQTGGDLKVAHCNDISCSSAVTYTLDSTGNVGEYTSITIGDDGLGLISFYDQTNGDLKVAHCNDINCSSATATMLDSSGVVGKYTSITIGVDGLGLISYYDVTNADLKVVHCSNINCSNAIAYTLASTGVVGSDTSITISGITGWGLISYFDSTYNYLKVANCSNINCSSAVTKTLIDDNVGSNTSITITPDGFGLISTFNQTNGFLKVAYCMPMTNYCMDASIYTLDMSGTLSEYTSITTRADGLTLVSYYDQTNGDLKVAQAYCRDWDCTDLNAYTFDSTGDVGLYTSIIFGVDGLPLISYYDDTNGDLKVAHCGTPFCISFFHRR